MSRYKRKKSLRGKNKKYTIQNNETCTLLGWLQTYKFMCQKPKSWFANQSFSQAELHEVYQAGLHHVAVELGYLRQSIEMLPQPIVASIKSSEQVA